MKWKQLPGFALTLIMLPGCFPGISAVETVDESRKGAMIPLNGD